MTLQLIMKFQLVSVKINIARITNLEYSEKKI